MNHSVWSMGVLCSFLAACGGAEDADNTQGAATGGSGGSTGGVPANTGGVHSDGGATTGGVTSTGGVASTGGVTGNENPPPPLPKTWQTFLNIAAMARGNGVYVAVGSDMEDYEHPEFPVIYTSPNGFTWTPSTVTLPAQATDVAFGNGEFVAVGSSASAMHVYRSEDGKTWTTSEVPDVGIPARDALAFGNGTFVVVSSDRVLTSTDGKEWKSTPHEPLKGIEFGAKKFAAWNGTKLESSKNGVDWTASAPLEGKVQYNDLRLFGSETGFQGVLGYFCCFGEVPNKYAAIRSGDAAVWNLDESLSSVPAVQEPGVCITFSQSPIPVTGHATFAAGRTCEQAETIATDHGFQPGVVNHDGPVFLLAGTAGIYSSDDGVHWEPTLIHSKQITF